MMILQIVIFIVSVFVLSWLSSSFIKTLVDIAKYLKWREFIIAFFVMGFAASLPNLFVDLNAALHGIQQISFGDIMGGNLVDLTLAMAIAVLMSRKFISTESKTGIDKHKEQLKMLFFNPGKKIPGIPFIGGKLDLYDEHAHKLYDYKLDIVEYKNQLCYVFSIKPKENLGLFSRDEIVVDEMTTWFDMKTLEVLGRNYSLSYKAGLYDFDVSMEVELTHISGMLVPKVLRYKGNWNVIFKKRERALFTATLFDFK